MKVRNYNLIFFALVLLTSVISPKARADTAASSEYRVKAAFLFNFIKFVDWPGEKENEKKPIIVGILGKNPFGDAFAPIKNKKVKGRNLIIKEFESFKDFKRYEENDKSEFDKKMKAVRECHVLFICLSEKKYLKEILDFVQDQSILTVGDMSNFVESGGITNLLLEEKKVRFEINVTAARKAGLQIRSQLLRMAKRVVDKKDVGRSIESTERQNASYAESDDKT